MRDPVQPLLIGAGNAVAMTGMSWAWVRRFARAHGIPTYRVGPRKQLVDGAALLEAIRRASEREQSMAPLTDEQERERMRRRLGLERVA